MMLTLISMVVHIYNISHWETKEGDLVQVQGQPDLHSEFQTSQDYRVRSCLKPQSCEVKGVQEYEGVVQW